MASKAAVQSPRREPKRFDRRDPSLDLRQLFDPDVAKALWDSLPEDCRRDHFDKKTMPAAYRGAVSQHAVGPAGTGWTSSYLNMRGLPEAMTWELAWLVNREVGLGGTISPSGFNAMTKYLRVATSNGGQMARECQSLLHLTSEEWVQHVRLARMKGAELGASHEDAVESYIRGYQDMLVYSYHRGPWWELDVWNPLLDARIPLRPHEPNGRNKLNLTRISSPWLRQATKWWLGAALEGNIYTWSTLKSRLDGIKWLQRYIDETGDYGPRLVVADSDLRPFVRGLTNSLRSHRVASGPRAGEPLKPYPIRQALTSIEQLYRWMFDNRAEATLQLNEPRWAEITQEYSVLFRPGDKPRVKHERHDELVLEDEVMSAIAAGAETLAKPASEGGLNDLSAFYALLLVLATGRRVNEILMMDFEPLLPLLGTKESDANGFVARLRYQRTKIDSSQPETIPVDEEVVAIVRAQQEVAREHMSRSGQPGRTPKYLFPARSQNRNGSRPYPAATFNLQLVRLTKRLSILDSLGNPVTISKTHQFRHTVATNLLNAGVPLHVVMRYLGHSSPEMTMHYAMTRSETAEREFLRFKKITSTGKPMEISSTELFDVLHLDQRADRVLPNGWCMLPPKQVCGRGNACLTCTMFVTDVSHQPELERQLSETEQLIAARKDAFLDRYGVEMSDDNVWLQGRSTEVNSLQSILLAVRTVDGSKAVRGSGSPRRQPGITNGEMG